MIILSADIPDILPDILKLLESVIKGSCIFDSQRTAHTTAISVR